MEEEARVDNDVVYGDGGGYEDGEDNLVMVIAMVITMVMVMVMVMTMVVVMAMVMTTCWWRRKRWM